MRTETVLGAIGLSVILLIGCPQATYPQSATHPPQLIGTWLWISDPDTLGKMWTQLELKSDGSYVYVGGWGEDISLVLRGPWEVIGDKLYQKMDVIAPARPIVTPEPGFVQSLTFSMPSPNTLVVDKKTYERVTK